MINKQKVNVMLLKEERGRNPGKTCKVSKIAILRFSSNPSLVYQVFFCLTAWNSTTTGPIQDWIKANLPFIH